MEAQERHFSLSVFLVCLRPFYPAPCRQEIMNSLRKANVDVKSQVQKGILRIPLRKWKVHLISQKVLN